MESIEYYAEVGADITLKVFWWTFLMWSLGLLSIYIIRELFNIDHSYWITITLPLPIVSIIVGGMMISLIVVNRKI